MKKIVFLLSFLILFITPLMLQATPKIVGEEVTYKINGTEYRSYIAWDASISGKRPAIVVVPEWWGITDLTRRRARMLAELGYIAIATDMYGDAKVATDPQQAKQYATPFYTDPKLGMEKIEAAIAKLKEYQQTDINNIAAIGYCFGGSMVLNACKMGLDFKGVVSFHGGLATVPAAKGVVKGKILVCHGADDKFVSEEDISKFKKNLDEVQVPYQFIVYPNATHAFTNPDATATGKKFNMPIAYNEAADKKSWTDMKKFLKSIFSAKY